MSAETTACHEEKIFAPLYPAADYVALVLKLPHRSATLKSKFMNKPKQYEKVFSDKTDLRVWPKIAIITRHIDSVSEKHRTRLKSSTENCLKTVRPIVSILVVGKLLGKLSFGERDLSSFSTALLTDEIIEQKLFIAPTARQILHDKRPQALCKRATARRAALSESQTALCAFARCECAAGFLMKYFHQESVSENRKMGTVKDFSIRIPKQKVCPRIAGTAMRGQSIF